MPWLQSKPKILRKWGCKISVDSPGPQPTSTARSSSSLYCKSRAYLFVCLRRKYLKEIAIWKKEHVFVPWVAKSVELRWSRILDVLDDLCDNLRRICRPRKLACSLLNRQTFWLISVTYLDTPVKNMWSTIYHFLMQQICMFIFLKYPCVLCACRFTKYRLEC